MVKRKSGRKKDRKKDNGSDRPLTGEALIKEVNQRIRVAISYWKAHNNRACRGEREKALLLYNQLTPEQKRKIPDQLRIWLRYRSEKYFGDHRTSPGTAQGKAEPIPGSNTQKKRRRRTQSSKQSSKQSPKKFSE